jgi:predicted nucleotidyltransferase
MNNVSKKLLALAHKNAASYLTYQKVRAIGVAGSIARGQADVYSDIDMSIYYEELPSHEELKAAYEQNQGSNYRIYSDESADGAIVE